MKITFLCLFTLILASCSPQETDPIKTKGNKNVADGFWTIPSEDIFDGGPGKDGIPSIDAPIFVPSDQANFLLDHDMVIVVSHNNILKAYPHPILDWHEIVNDQIGDFSFALTYCPLTGTAINWNRNINGTETTFGVSGLLYNSNLIPYDRASDSNWSQMKLVGVNGENSGRKIETKPVFEGRWGQVKSMKDLQVLSKDTGFSRDYDIYPYGDYRTNHSNIIFPVSNTDDRKNAKDRVLGVFDNLMPKIYSFDSFTSDFEEIILDRYNDSDIMVVGYREKDYMVAFYPDSERTYEPLVDDFPYVLKDDQGNIYDVFGQSKFTNDKLSQPEQFIGYWFSWAAFYPDLKLYTN